MDKFDVKNNEGYTYMSNHHLRDKNLSHAARGLLSFMLSLPENWDYSFNGLVSISKESKFAIRTIINELKKAKYIKINRFNNDKGQFQYNYAVYSFPYDIPRKIANYPTPDYQSAVEPTSVNQTQINTNINNDKINNIDKTKNLKHKSLINELIRLNYITDNDEQLSLYDSLFDKLVEDGYSYVNIYSSIHYIVPKVISRNFKDDNNDLIINRFGYLKTSMESNFKKFDNYDNELYSDEDFN